MSIGNKAVHISSCDAIRLHTRRNVIPARPTQRRLIELSALDLPLLTQQYIRKAFFYPMPADFSSAVELVAKSLSEILVSFCPLAGRLSTSADGVVSIDCNDAGAELLEASTDDISVADVSAEECTPAVQHLFPLGSAANLEGHHLPLFAVQVTKLRDGISVGCAINHAVVDGASFWHFFNSWTDLCSGKAQVCANPIHDRRLIGSSTVRLNRDLKEEIPQVQHSPAQLRTKAFRFSKETLKGLKDEANRGSPVPISSFQALCGHVWKAVTRARGLGPDELTTLVLIVNLRSRLLPPLPSEYFGNAIKPAWVTLPAEELARNGISFPAGLLHGAIQGLDDKAIREQIDAWQRDPAFRFKFGENLLLIGGSPWFRMYENDLGWGDPVAVRCGVGNNVDGESIANQGKEGRGSVELQMCLAAHAMEALETDQRFLFPLPTHSVLGVQISCDPELTTVKERRC